MIEIELPYPPTVNHYKRAGRVVTMASGKKYQLRVNTDATKQFYYEAWLRIRSLIANVAVKSFDRATILSVELDVYPPDKRRRDIDNLAKVTLDALVKGGLMVDDYQIARLLITRMDIIKQGKVIVRIQELK